MANGKDNFELLLSAVLDSKSEQNIVKELDKLNKQVGKLKISIDEKSIQAIGNAMKEAMSQVKLVNETIVKEHEKTKKKVEDNKVKVFDNEEIDKQLKAIEKIGKLAKTESFSFIDDGGAELVKIVDTYKDSMGSIQTITSLVDKETSQLVEVSEKLSSSAEAKEQILKSQERLLATQLKATNSMSDKSSSLMRTDGFLDDKSSNDIIKQGNQIKQTLGNLQKLNMKGEIISESELLNLQRQLDVHNRILQVKQKQYDRVNSSIKQEEKKKQYLIEQEKSLNKYANTLSKISGDSNFKGQTMDTAPLEKYQDMIQSISSSKGGISDAQITQIKQARQEVEKYIVTQQELLALNKKLSDSEIELGKARNKIDSKLVGLSGMNTKDNEKHEQSIKDLSNRYEELYAKLAKGEISVKEFGVETGKLDNDVKSLKNEIKQATKETDTFADAMKRFSAMYGMYEMFQLGKRAISDMVGSVIELDKAIVEVNKVADVPNMDKFIEQSYALGESISVSGKSIVDGVGEFARMGKTIEESMDLSQVANEMVLVGDGIDNVSEASGVLQSALALFEKKGYDARDVLDLINQTANKTGATFEAVAEIVKRSSTLGLSGSSLEEIIGLGAALFEVTRDAEASATALNMINQRLMGLTDEGEYSVELVSKLGTELEKLTGVKVMEDDGELRSTFDILQDINKEWKTMPKNIQVATSTLVGNNRHAKSFIAIMENFDTVNKSIAESNVASGSSQKELEAYMNSLSGALVDLQSSWEKLSITTINSQFVEDVVRATTEIIKLIDACGGLIPPLTTILGVLVAYKSTKIADFFGGMSTQILKVAENLGTFSIATKVAATSTTGAAVATTTLGTALNTIVPILGLMTAAYGIVKSASEVYKNNIEENARALSSETQEMKNQLSSYDELVGKYQGLIEEKKKGFDVTQDLILIQEKLVESFGSEMDGIDLVNGSYLENLGLINEIIGRKEKLLYLNNVKMGENGEKNLTKSRNSFVDARGMFDRRDTRKVFEGMDKEFVEGAFDIVNTGFEYKVRVKPELDKKDMEIVLEEVRNSFLESGKGDSKFLQEWTNQTIEIYENLNQIDESSRSVAQNAIDSIKRTHGVFDSSKATAEQFGKIMNEVSSKYGVDAFGLGESADFNKEVMSQLKQEFSQFYPEVDTTGKVIDSTKSSFIDLTQQFSEAIPKVFSVQGALDELNSTQTLSEESIKSLAKAYPELEESMDNYLELSLALSQLALEEDIAKTEEGVRLLNQSINSLNEGQTLTSDTIKNLLDTYPQLRSQITETNGVYTISKEALEDLRDMTIEEQKVAIQANANKSLDLKAQTEFRLDCYRRELEALKTLAQAQAQYAMSKNTTGSVLDRAKKGLTNMVGNQEEIEKMNQLIIQEENLAKSYQDRANQANNMLQNFDISTSTGNTKKGSNISNKSSKKDNAKKELKDMFDAMVNEIQEGRRKLEYQMQLVENELGVAELKGDTKKTNELNGKLSSLIAEHKALTTAENERYRGMEKTFKGTEHQADLEKLIQDNSLEWWEVRQRQIEKEIELIQEKNNLEREALDNRNKEIDLLMGWENEDSEKYLELEQEKIENSIAMRKLAEQEIQKLRALGNDEENKAIKEAKDLWYDAYNEYFNLIKTRAERERQAAIERNKTEIENLEKSKKALESIHKMALDMIKKEIELKKKAIQEEISGYEKIINSKKQALREGKEEEDYNKNLKSKEKVVSDLEAKLLAMSNDNSSQAQAKKLELEEELRKAKEEMETLQNDKKLSEQEKALDEELENFKDEKQEELDALDEYLSKTGELNAKALELLKSKNKDLYNKLLEYNKKYGDGSVETINNLWEEATTSIDKYKNSNMSLLEIMKDITEELKRQNEESNRLQNDSTWQDYVPNQDKPDGGGSSNPNLSVIKEMKENSEKWKSASKEEKKRLSERNKKLGDSIGAYYDDKTGVWFSDASMKRKLYDTVGIYHQGGIVGGMKLKSNEEFAKLMKGEVVVNSDQIENFMKGANSSINQGGLGEIQQNFEFNIEGGVDKDSLLPILKKFGATIKMETIEAINKANRNRGLKPRIG